MQKSNTVTTYKLKTIEAESYKRNEMTPKQIQRMRHAMSMVGMIGEFVPSPDVEVITEQRDAPSQH